MSDVKEKLKTRVEILGGYNGGESVIRHDRDMADPYIYDLTYIRLERFGDFRWFNFMGLDVSKDASEENNIIIGDE